ncbi:MAG: toll/interleukin-1 receptor domain-containing protein [Candidatus Woesearchaeota archaeon]
MEEGIKLFLSHNSADKVIVKKIANVLTSQGFSVWFDDREIKAGDSLSEKINEGLNNHDVFIIFLSENSITSSWVQKELKIVLEKRNSRKSRNKIIPLKLDNCKVPSYLEKYYYIDLSNEKFNASINKLLDSILTKQVLKDKYSHSFPGKAILDNVEVSVDISGINYKNSKFIEKVTIVPIRKLYKYWKELNVDGELQSINCSSGELYTSKSANGIYKLETRWSKPLEIGKKYSFKYEYAIIDEFLNEKNWYYRIESPTRKVTFIFSFDIKNYPDKFKVINKRELAILEELQISPIIEKNKVTFIFSNDFPDYRDYYEFTWE